ncbi:MAG TPA: cytochrome c-type biogenesis protein [Solirubrobacterales bacterium]|nr:cytochrome c-type biogenesis protein [Solirubrobacterales bacterium]
MSGRAVALLAAALLAVSAAPAGAATPKVEQNVIEAEVMCPVCGTLLELAESPQALRQKAFVARLIADGRSKEEIKDALVAEYGEEVLALPSGDGFSLSAYLVPIVAFVLAVVALAFGVRRWRRDGSDGPTGPAPAGPSDAESKRLDADLSRYDL